MHPTNGCTHVAAGMLRSMPTDAVVVAHRYPDHRRVEAMSLSTRYVTLNSEAIWSATTSQGIDCGVHNSARVGDKPVVVLGISSLWVARLDACEWAGARN
jgi:hypothetical protein